MAGLAVLLAACQPAETAPDGPTADPVDPPAPTVTPEPEPSAAVVPTPVPPAGEVAAADEPEIDLGGFEGTAASDPPAAELCNPDDPDDDNVDLVEPEEEQVEPVETELGPGARFTFSNERDQRVAVTAVAASTAQATTDLIGHAFCLEAVVNAEPAPPTPRTGEAEPALEDALIDGVVRIINRRLADLDMRPIDVDQLAQHRDDSAAEHSPTLAELVDSYGVDADTAMEELIDLLGPGYASDGDVGAAVEQLWHQPDAPFLVTNDEASERADIEVGGLVVYEFELLDPMLDEPDVDELPLALLANIDPPINKKDTKPWRRAYRAKCQQSAWARLNARAGRMTLTIWRKRPTPQWKKSDYRNAEWERHRGPRIEHRSGRMRPYDIKVRGWENESRYRVGGYWELGTGGGC